ncbi:hypothetical protein [Pseudomonas kulmbachensis]|uniref:hypothetical protein n=1 Tax=Pseudomonas kulmbachensis TaxID=3043408 RepID=UPI002AB12A85|nr:hypothetical protein [Pseudomonas sp. FLM 004-28]
MMKKADALYSFLIEQLTNICDDEERAVQYIEFLQDENEGEEFESIVESLVVVRDALVECHQQLEPYDNLPHLEALLLNFKQKFSAYPEFDYKKCLYSIRLAERVFQGIQEIPSEDVIAGFDFFYADLSFECKAFATNLAEESKNIIWLTPGSNDSLNELLNLSTNPEFWFCLASNVNAIDFTNGLSIVFCHGGCVDGHRKNPNVLSLLKLHMVSAGYKINRSFSYNCPPSNSSLAKYDPASSYSQFGDVISILGEYVDRQDVLSKYLSIYHVIENFMFKSQIVKLERANQGVMFSIRDFKRLYRSVDMEEQKVLGRLVSSVFDLPYNNGVFGVDALAKWEAFLIAHAADRAEIDTFLAKLISPAMPYAPLGNFRTYFSTLLYQIRCSIVHNKETEYHISSETYTNGCALVLERFFLPVLEEFVFLTMAEDNSIVWYSQDKITLWDKTA